MIKSQWFSNTFVPKFRRFFLPYKEIKKLEVLLENLVDESVKTSKILESRNTFLQLQLQLSNSIHYGHNWCSIHKEDPYAVGVCINDGEVKKLLSADVNHNYFVIDDEKVYLGEFEVFPMSQIPAGTARFGTLKDIERGREDIRKHLIGEITLIEDIHFFGEVINASLDNPLYSFIHKNISPEAQALDAAEDARVLAYEAENAKESPQQNEVL